MNLATLNAHIAAIEEQRDFLADELSNHAIHTSISGGHLEFCEYDRLAAEKTAAALAEVSARLLEVQNKVNALLTYLAALHLPPIAQPPSPL